MKANFQAFKAMSVAEISAEMRDKGIRWAGVALPVAVDEDGRPITGEVRPGYFCHFQRNLLNTYCLQGKILGAATVRTTIAGSVTAFEAIYLGIVLSRLDEGLQTEKLLVPMICGISDRQGFGYYEAPASWKRQYSTDSGLWRGGISSEIAESIIRPRIGKYAVVRTESLDPKTSVQLSDPVARSLANAMKGSWGETAVRIGQALRNGYQSPGADGVKALDGTGSDQQGMIERVQKLGCLPAELTWEEFVQVPPGQGVFMAA